MPYDIKKTIVTILEAIKDKKKFDPSTFGVTKESFYDALELISDNNLAKNITFARGGRGNKILVAFYDSAQITLPGLEYINEFSISETQNPVTSNSDNINSIFLSYCWDDSSIADEIDEYFSKKIKGINIKRDIRDIGEWKSIREFMKSIRDEDYAILIVSNKYLKSANCMFEVLEIMKEKQYSYRIFPVVLERKIYDPLGRIDFIKYWENECEKLEDGLKTIRTENSAELVLELRKRKQISSSIAEFLSLVSDMNNPKIEDVTLAIESKLKEDNIKFKEPAKDIEDKPKSSEQISNHEDILNLVMKNPIENWNYFDEYGEYVLKADTNLKIVRDSFEKKQPFHESWATKHPDPTAYMYKYTIFYNNSRIEEFFLVAVDGLRSYLPLPKINTSIISRKDYLLAKAVNIDGRLEEYIDRSGLIVNDI